MLLKAILKSAGWYVGLLTMVCGVVVPGFLGMTWLSEAAMAQQRRTQALEDCSGCPEPPGCWNPWIDPNCC